MKHHEYQIYYGGWKIKLKGLWYCKDCHSVVFDDELTKNLNEPKSEHYELS